MSLIKSNAVAPPPASGGSLSSISEMNSLRFDGSSYLSRTPTTTTNSSRTTWTWSGWAKFTNITSGGRLFAAGTADTNGTSFGHLGSSPNLEATFQFYTIHSGTADYGWNSMLKLRDSSAWYHIVVVYDSSTGSGGMNAYINGVQITNFATDYGTLPSNAQGLVNAQNSHTIGRHQTLNSGFHYGYLANIHFIDGQALDANSFGETISDVWVPKAYSGTYGTNGFHLDFADGIETLPVNGSNVSAFRDKSGNDNHWQAH